MTGATATIREVKNKDTGIDVAVTSYKETKAMIGATYEFQVMVVSNLSYFKTPKHKENDNVQFTVLKKFAEFEELFTKLNTKFSGTVFPPLPKKVLMMSDAVAKERRAGLDHLVKYIAMTPKICTCSVVLEFLGVGAIKAGKFRKMEVSDAVIDKQAGTGDEADNEAGTEQNEAADKQDVDEDLFEMGEGNTEDQGDDDDLFDTAGNDTDAAGSTKIFGEQDLSGAFDEDAEDDLFLPEARVERTAVVTQSAEEDEDQDLFRIEDDNLDEIMQLNLKPQSEEPQEGEEEAVETEDPERDTVIDDHVDADKTQQGEVIEDIIPEHEQNRPEPEISVPKPDDSAPKPEVSASKPKVSAPKPEVSAKPGVSALKPEISAKPELKPKPRPKPAARPKPPIKAKPSLSEENTDSPFVEKDSKSSQSETALQKPVPSPRPKPPLKQKPQLAAKPDVKPKPKSVQASTDTDSATDASESLGGLANENITEDDIMNYIQANTADADEADLFS